MPQAEIVAFYLDARSWVHQHSDWLGTIGWSDSFDDYTASDFMSIYAWAVYVSGYRARYLQRHWGALTTAWRGFEPPAMDNEARDASLRIIGHHSKADAILKVAGMITTAGWEVFKAERCQSAATLKGLPWVRETNSRFLARNLRLADVGKPDVWIRRAAAKFGVSIEGLFDAIQQGTGDGPGYADAVLWAYLSDNVATLGDWAHADVGGC